VPDGEVVGNVQHIDLCNQGLNPCSFTGRFLINDRNMPNLFSGTVAGHHGLPHSSTLSTVNNTDNY